MDKPQFFIGIDIASESFTCSVGTFEQGWQRRGAPSTFANTLDGFQALLHWLQERGVSANNSVVCMEATGVYCEQLAHYLVAQHFRVAIEPPLRVKRAFKPFGHKSDPVDSNQIGQYSARFFDQLSFWSPRGELLEQIQTLLTLREQLVSQRTAHHNAQHALHRKQRRVRFAEQVHLLTIQELGTHILQIEQEIQRLVAEDPDLKDRLTLLLTIPGVGFLLAAHMLVLFEIAHQPFDPKSLAAFLGICPYENSSGSSLQHTPTSRHFGPPGIRRLLYLASLSLSHHNPRFSSYYQQKTTRGKPKKLVCNNIANKLLKIMVAVVRDRQPFNPNHQPLPQPVLRQALTKS